jgi:hypothetical protein
VIACVELPSDHKFPFDSDDVNKTLSPAQKVIGPFAKIVGIAGVGLTITVVGNELLEQPFRLLTVTK